MREFVTDKGGIPQKILLTSCTCTVPRDEWRESGSGAADKAAASAANLFTYEDELYVIGGYSTRGMGNKLFK